MCAARIAYFAYGSNLDKTQMTDRCSSAEDIGRFVLENHRLCFPRRSTTNWPGSGVASIAPEPGSNVEGVVYTLTPKQFEHLANIEGVPTCYEICSISVKSVATGRSRKVRTLIAVPEEPDGSFDPDPEYLETIERGAKAHKLSSSYRGHLKQLKEKAQKRRQFGNVVHSTVQLIGPGKSTASGTCQECNKETGGAMCPDHPKAPVSVTVTAPMRALQMRWRIAPLHFHLAEPLVDASKDVQKPPPKEADVLNFLCSDGLSKSVDGFVSRYRELSKNELPTVPDDETIVEKLVTPLLEAKRNYMLGNYFAVITLCGMVCEVLSVIRYEMTPLKRGDKPLTEEEQKKMFGSTVDNLTQERRIELLHVLKYIDDTTAEDFHDVRNRRNNYVHLSKNPVSGRKSDAKGLYELTIKLIITVFGIEPSGGDFKMNSTVIDYVVANSQRAKTP